MNAPQCTLLAALALSLCACKNESPDGDRSKRLLLTPAPGSSTPQPTTLRTVRAADSADWTIDAARSERGTISSAEGSPVECLFLDGIPRRVWIPIQPGERFNEVRVTLFAPTSERVAIYARRGTETLSTSSERQAPRSRTPSTLSFELPSLPILGDCEHLVIDLLGGTSRPGIVKVELIHRPAASFFPDPALGPAPIVLDETLFETRTGYAIRPSSPLTTTLEHDGPAILRFEHGPPAHHGSHGQGALHIDIATKDNGIIWDLDLPTGTLWKAEGLDLGALSGPVTIRFSLAGARDDSAHLIANPRLASPSPDAPTVLFITSDTHRADHMGTHAFGLVHTPALVALAKRGVLFEDTLASTNITNPSHVSLLTGLEVRDHQIIDNGTPLTSRAATLAEAFQAAGWRTLGCVSVEHLSDKNSGLGQGFDRLLPPPDSTRDVIDTTAELSRALADFAGEPLFCWLHLFDAHSPYEPPAPYDRLHYSKSKDPRDPSRRLAYPGRFLPVTLRGITDMEWPAAQYRGEIDFLDSQLKAVFEHPRFTDAVIAFSADHGECFGAHGIYWDHSGVYPDTLHVPLILSWPGGPRGIRTTAPARQLDLGRTLLDLAGLDATPFPGRDLRWTLDDPTDTRPRFALAGHGYSVSLAKDGWFCVLNLRGHQKAAETRPFIAHSLELYHRAEDLACTADLVDQHPERARAMRAELIAWLGAGGTDGLGGATDASSERRADLAALGYTADEDARQAGEDWFPAPCTEGEAGATCTWCARFD